MNTEPTAEDRITLLRALAMADSRTEDNAVILYSLSLAQWERFSETEDKSFAADSIHTARLAFAAARADSARNIELLETLAVWLVELANAAADSDLFDAAVEAARSALAAGGADLHVLGTVLRLRFDHGGQVADIEEADQVLTDAVQLGDHHGGATSATLAELAHVLDLRHEVTGDADYALRSVEYWRRAVGLTEPGDEWEQPRRARLAQALLESFRLDGPGTPGEALTQVRLALWPTPTGPDYETCHTAALTLLACAQLLEHTTSGDLLAQAEAAARSAVDAAEADDDEHQVLQGKDLLATVLHARFERTRERAQLDAAIALSTEVAEHAGIDHDDRAGRLTNLGTALLERFMAFSDVADLDAAVDAHRLALTEIADDHHDRARYLNNLSVALCRRHIVRGRDADLAQAIRLGEQAASAPQGGVERALRMSTLGDALFHRFARFGDVADLDRDIDLLRAAIGLMPARDSDLVGLMSNLGSALHFRHSWLGGLDDLREALGILDDAVTISVPPAVRSTVVDA
ncbi:hypothetical protein, partial [Kutzneria sp. 744]|uniref:hypothetical protein n=1 Tax=Kutzneria sp. (strain 744) TaxID=345341 RepID=UPI001E30CEBE